MTSKEKLIEATRQLLWEQGYEATSPRDILKRAGVGQGVLYHHFRGKLDLATVAMEATVDEMIAQFDHLVADEKPPVARIWDYLTHAREALKGCRAGRMVMESAVVGSPLQEPVKRYFSHVRSRLAAALEEAVHEGSVTLSVDADDLAALLVAVVQGGYLLARAAGESDGMEAPLRGVLSLLGGSVRS